MTTTKEDVQAQREYVESLRQTLAAEEQASASAAASRVNDISAERLKREEQELLARIQQARGVNEAAGIEPTPEYQAVVAGEPLPDVESDDPSPRVDETQTITGPNDGEASDSVVVNPDLPPPPVDVAGNVNDGVTPPVDPEVDDPADLPVRNK